MVKNGSIMMQLVSMTRTKQRVTSLLRNCITITQTSMDMGDMKLLAIIMEFRVLSTDPKEGLNTLSLPNLKFKIKRQTIPFLETISQFLGYLAVSWSLYILYLLSSTGCLTLQSSTFDAFSFLYTFVIGDQLQSFP